MRQDDRTNCITTVSPTAPHSSAGAIRTTSPARWHSCACRRQAMQLGRSSLWMEDFWLARPRQQLERFTLLHYWALSRPISILGPRLRAEYWRHQLLNDRFAPRHEIAAR